MIASVNCDLILQSNGATHFSGFVDYFMKNIKYFARRIECLPLVLDTDQRHVDIFDPVEYGVHETSHIYPLCEIFYFPWHRHPDGKDQRILVALPKDPGEVG